MSLLCPPKPHFFQPLLPGFLTNFSMPKSFHKYLGAKHDDDDERDNGANYKKIIAKLRDKGGGTWDVTIDYDGLRFVDGWEKFCLDHDLQIGYFLVFMHQGNWVFDVLVFDHTTCELDFPAIPYDSQPMSCECDFPAIPDESQPMTCELDFPAIPNESQPKTRELDFPAIPNESQRKICGRDFWAIPDESQPKRKRRKKSANQRSSRNRSTAAHRSRKGYSKNMGDEEHLERKSSFKPNGFPYFHRVVKPYCFNCGSCFIPMKFGRQNGLTKRWCDMVLIDEKGKSWSMKLRHMNTSRRNGGSPYICGGWSAFLKAHGLNGGDHVIIELIDSGNKPVMKLYRETCDICWPITDTGKEVIKAKNAER